MFCLQSRHFLLMPADEVFTAAEQFLTTLHVELLSFHLLGLLDLLLQDLRIFVESTLPQVVSSSLHLDNSAREVKPWACDCAVFNGLAEFV